MQKYIVEVYKGKTVWMNEQHQFHRIGGPAVEYADGYKAYYQNGLFHRESGPAVEYENGDKEYYRNDELHREDGPAVEYSTGAKEYWINGEELTEDEFNNRNCIPNEVTINGVVYKRQL